MNATPTLRACDIVTMHVLALPVHPLVQLVATFVAGVAVSVTTVPVGNGKLHVPDLLIPLL